MRLTDEDIQAVSRWLGTKTWAESRDYLNDHVAQLVTPATDIALCELALLVPVELIEQHRVLLATAADHGIASAYRPALLGEALDLWLTSRNRASSQAFLQNHPELLDEEVRAMLSRRRENSQTPTIAVHQAVLALAAGPAGINGAYLCLDDLRELDALLTKALLALDPGRLEACAVVEAIAHRRAFLGTFHLALARLLADPAGQLPEGLTGQLASLAADADSAELDSAKVQLAGVLAEMPGDSSVTRQLQDALTKAGS